MSTTERTRIRIANIKRGQRFLYRGQTVEAYTDPTSSGGTTYLRYIEAEGEPTKSIVAPSTQCLTIIED